MVEVVCTVAIGVTVIFLCLHGKRLAYVSSTGIVNVISNKLYRGERKNFLP